MRKEIVRINIKLGWKEDTIFEKRDSTLYGEEMKQRVKDLGTKIKWLNSRINQYKQNRMLANNQGRFFQRLNNKEENHQCEIPNSVEA